MTEPNWSNHKILRHEVVVGTLVVEVYFPEARLHGRKVLVFEEVSSIERMEEKTGGNLDPHFGAPFPPVARFAPTDDGWKLACNFASSLEFE